MPISLAAMAAISIQRLLVVGLVFCVLAPVLTTVVYHQWHSNSTNFLGVGANANNVMPKDGHTYFFSIGDFGVAACQTAYQSGDTDDKGGIGHQNCKAEKQSTVAVAMDKLARLLAPSFVLSLGDNFYVRGVKNLDDPQFKASFEDVYNGLETLSKIPWRIALGDHDHRGNVSALLAYGNRNSQWLMPAAYYSFTVPVPGGDSRIRVAVTDSVGLEGAADEGSVAQRRFGDELSDEFAGRAAGDAQWRWLDSFFAGDSADGQSRKPPSPAMTMVVGHRPALTFVNRSRTASERQVAAKLRKQMISSSLAPVLYIHGHDHAMQHSAERGGNVYHVGNGVGGMDVHPFERGDEPELFRWGSTGVFGFIVHEVGPSSMALHFVDGDSQTVVHTLDIPYAERT